MPFGLWARSWNMCQRDPEGVLGCDSGTEGAQSGGVRRLWKGAGTWAFHEARSPLWGLTCPLTSSGSLRPGTCLGTPNCSQIGHYFPTFPGRPQTQPAPGLLLGRGHGGLRNPELVVGRGGLAFRDPAWAVPKPEG